MVSEARKWELDDDITFLNSFTDASVFYGVEFSHPVTEVSSRMNYPKNWQVAGVKILASTSYTIYSR